MPAIPEADVIGEQSRGFSYFPALYKLSYDSALGNLPHPIPLNTSAVPDVVLDSPVSSRLDLREVRSQIDWLPQECLVYTLNLLYLLRSVMEWDQVPAEFGLAESLATWQHPKNIVNNMYTT